MEQNPITISISFGTIAKTVFFLILIFLVYQLLDLLLVVLTAVVIASGIEPATRWFGKYKVPRVIAVLTIYVIIASFLFGVVFLFIPPVLNDMRGLTSQLPEYINSINLFDTGVTTNALPGVFSQGLAENLTSSISISDALETVNRWINQFRGNFFQLMSTIFGGALSFILIVVISFYLAVQKRGIENFLSIITPMKHEPYIIDLWHRSQKKIGLWLQGQLLLAFLVGVLVYLGLTVFGIKYALLLALIAAIFELIPIFGPILAGVPAVILAAVDGGLSSAFLVLILYVIIQQFENQLLYPLVVRQVIGVPPIIAIVAIIAGGTLAGLLGVILSVPIAAILMELFSDIDEEKHHLRKGKTQTI